MMRYWIDCELKQPNLFESHAELEITKTEIEDAIRSLKTGKAPGTDNIPVELLKTKTKKKKKILVILHKICNKIWTSGTWSNQWTKSIIFLSQIRAKTMQQI